MKRLAILLCIPLMLAGCKTSTTAPPLAPGYSNPQDQQIGQILAGARAFYVSIQQQSASGQLTLSPAEKTGFNDFGTALNAADSVYLAYHAGNATEAQAQAAANVVAAKQSALTLPGATK